MRQAPDARARVNRRHDVVTSFESRYALFCAAEARTLTPKLIVEARSHKEPRYRLGALGNWLEWGALTDYIVLEFSGQLDGIPLFLKEFFRFLKIHSQRQEPQASARHDKGTVY